MAGDMAQLVKCFPNTGRGRGSIESDQSSPLNLGFKTEVCAVKDLKICSQEVLLRGHHFIIPTAWLMTDVWLYFFNSSSVIQFIWEKMFWSWNSMCRMGSCFTPFCFSRIYCGKRSSVHSRLSPPVTVHCPCSHSLDSACHSLSVLFSPINQHFSPENSSHNCLPGI